MHTVSMISSPIKINTGNVDLQYIMSPPPQYMTILTTFSKVVRPVLQTTVLSSEVLHSEFRYSVLRSFVEHQNVELSHQSLFRSFVEHQMQNVELSHQRLFCKSKMMCFHFVSPSISNVMSRAPFLADSNEL